jgi:uncharacterized membrane protein YvbJ
MSDLRTCPHCGQPMGADDGACPSCGRASALPAAPTSPPPSSSNRAAAAALRSEVAQLLGFLLMFAPLAIGVVLIALGVFNLLILLPAMLVAGLIGAYLWRIG